MPIPSIIEKLKKDDIKGTFSSRLATLDYTFWSSWKGILLLVSFPIVVLAGWGGMILMDNPAEPWGTFGDAFAPVTAFFTCLALEAAVVTLIQQRKELSESHELYKLQKEEIRLLGAEQHLKREQGVTAEEANKIAKERLDLDIGLQYMQLLQLRDTLEEAGRVEELRTLNALIEKYSNKLQ